MGRLSDAQTRRLRNWALWTEGLFFASTAGTGLAIATDNDPILVISAGLFTMSILCFWGFIQVIRDIAKDNGMAFYELVREVSNDDE